MILYKSMIWKILKNIFLVIHFDLIELIKDHCHFWCHQRFRLQISMALITEPIKVDSNDFIPEQDSENLS